MKPKWRWLSALAVYSKGAFRTGGGVTVTVVTVSLGTWDAGVCDALIGCVCDKSNRRTAIRLGFWVKRSRFSTRRHTPTEPFSTPPTATEETWIHWLTFPDKRIPSDEFQRGFLAENCLLWEFIQLQARGLSTPDLVGLEWTQVRSRQGSHRVSVWCRLITRKLLCGVYGMNIQLPDGFSEPPLTQTGGRRTEIGL